MIPFSNWWSDVGRLCIALGGCWIPDAEQRANHRRTAAAVAERLVDIDWTALEAAGFSAPDALLGCVAALAPAAGYEDQWFVSRHAVLLDFVFMGQRALRRPESVSLAAIEHAELARAELVWSHIIAAMSDHAAGGDRSLREYFLVERQWIGSRLRRGAAKAGAR